MTALIVAGSLLAGCATTKTLQPISGSRADGTVVLAYEYGVFEQPQPQWDLALVTARERCRAWGYNKAQPFGGGQKQCVAVDGYGSCMRWIVKVTYQCSTDSAP